MNQQEAKTKDPQFEQMCAGMAEVFATLDRHASVAVLGVDIRKYEPVFFHLLGKNGLSTRRIRSLILDGHIFFGLSVIDNILFHQRESIFLSRKKATARVKTLLQEYDLPLNLTDDADNLPRETQKLLNVLSAYLAKLDCVVVEDCMADMSMNGTVIYCSILERMKAEGCKVIYLTTRWEDAVKVAEWLMLINNNGMLERSFDAMYVRNNPRELIQLLGSGVYHRDDSKTTTFVQAVNAIIQSNSVISRNTKSTSMEAMASIIRKTLHAEGGFIYIEKQGAPVENPARIPTGLNYEKLNEQMNQKTSSLFYWTVRDSYFEDLFLEKAEAVQTIMTVPIYCRNEYWGFCGVWFDHVFLYSQEHLLMLSTLANETAIMMETSRLMSRSLLLQESHHRIKNNLQMIISLLYIQKDQSGEDRHFADAIQATVGRVKSIASVHDILSGDTHGSNAVELKELTACVLKMYQNTGIRYHTSIEEIYVVQQFAPTIALILNELLSNSFKHAFVGLGGDYPRGVQIQIGADHETVVLRVQDNGIGMPEEAGEKSTLGMLILHTLVETELKGDIFWESGNGTTVTAKLPIASNFTKMHM